MNNSTQRRPAGEKGKSLTLNVGVTERKPVPVHNSRESNPGLLDRAGGVEVLVIS